MAKTLEMKFALKHLCFFVFIINIYMIGFHHGAKRERDHIKWNISLLWKYCDNNSDVINKLVKKVNDQ